MPSAVAVYILQSPCLQIAVAWIVKHLTGRHAALYVTSVIVTILLRIKQMLHGIWGSHGGVAEEPRFVGCDAVLFGDWVLIF